MKRIYLALSIWAALFFVVAGVLGWKLARGAVEWKQYHVLAGLFTSIFVCLVHSLVFIHLLGTGLGVKRAIEEHQLPEGPRALLFRYKMRSFPPCFGVMVATITTAVLGGMALAHRTPAPEHRTFVVVAFLAHCVTAPWVFRQLGANERTLRDVERQLEAKTRAVVAGTAAPPL